MIDRPSSSETTDKNYHYNKIVDIDPRHKPLMSGFSKLSKSEKINLLSTQFFQNPQDTKELWQSFWHSNTAVQKNIDNFSENSISNFHLPYSVAPNFLINGRYYHIPLVIEESSVVAAASKAAKFWAQHGGFKATVLSSTKVGQVHCTWKGNPEDLKHLFNRYKNEFINELAPLEQRMKKRGGGIIDIELLDRTADEPDLFQLNVSFDTVDAMGANFINTILEQLSLLFKAKVDSELSPHQLQVIMSIVSNYTPKCVVHVYAQCPIDSLRPTKEIDDPDLFAYKFEKAIRISKLDVYRATTHNKGIFNGIDAVILATGNDFRAVEACGHAYACRNGRYEGLTDVEVNQRDRTFTISLKIPMAVGTVGGLTTLHPLVKASLNLLDHPNSGELMKIAATVGLAQNFAAITSLVTSGIQKGHMKMHLLNILNHLGATNEEIVLAKEYFKTQLVSYANVQNYLELQRKIH